MTALEDKLSEIREEASPKKCDCSLIFERTGRHAFWCSIEDLGNPTVLRLVEAVKDLRGELFTAIDKLCTQFPAEWTGVPGAFKDHLDSRLMKILEGK